MAPLPPPPPPAPPPPPMGGPPPSGPPKLKKNEAVDRNALLSQIRGGAKLKKTKAVNDRSAPIIDGKSSSIPSGPPGGANKPVSNGPVGPMQLGGLFAGGVPKLKPTGSKLVSNGLTVSANKVNNSCTKTDESVRRTPSNNTSSIKTSLEDKFQNNSSFLHANANTGYGLCVANNSNKFHTMKAREKPSFVLGEGKGQAPQVPSQTNKSNAPELPRKPPGVQRSNSQSSGRSGPLAGRRPGPPSMKPPPPPKSTPSQASQSAGVTRIQSFNQESRSNTNNQSDNWSSRPDITALVNNFNQQAVRPPAPPRNGSTIVGGVSNSPSYPPPPPPVSTIPTRSNSSAVRTPSQLKSNAPNIPTQPVKTTPPARPPIGPPPPPPHRTTSNATSNYPLPPPPSQTTTKMIPMAYRNGNIASAPAPPPPVRNTSMSRDQPSAEFSSRFSQFKAIFELPAPTPMTASNKVYPSQMQQSQRRRDPPPPPPQSNGMAGHSPNMNAHNGNAKKSNPVLRIQIGSAVTQS